MSRLGYVVVEYNQASARPELTDGDVHNDRKDARARRDELADETARVGRGERFVVAVLVPLTEEVSQ